MKPMLTTILAVFVSSVLPSAAWASPNVLSLGGNWRFQLDRDNSGLREQWFTHTLKHKVRLPGSLPAQGIGDDITVDTKWTGDIVDKSWFTAPEYAPYRQPGNIKVPFWLQPEKYYAGPAWYQRDIEIPRDWADQRVVLELERPHWETRIWLDGREIGSNDSLSTPHEYELGTGLKAGRHQLTIRVDNGLVVDVGVNSHSITDHTQGNWNGIVGALSLQATPVVWVDDVQVWPDFARQAVRISMALHNASGAHVAGQVRLSLEPASRDARTDAPVSAPISKAFESEASQRALSFELPMTGLKRWDEFAPSLYRLEVALNGTVHGKALTFTRDLTFGLRELGTQGTQFVLNGRKIFLRGTLECCIFPKTGHPPTDVASWKRIITIAKAHGLNLIRFHSWCPPEAAFVAADELGFYYQVEIASWANQSTTLGDGKPVDQWLYREAERILKAYGSHPSFMLMPYGNEPGGKKANEYLAKWVDHWKTTDPRRLYTSGSGWPQLPENQFHVTPDPRIQQWGEGLKSRINARPPETRTDYREYIAKRNVPVISHEIGQWCVYPNFDEIPKYTGYLKPKNFEIFRDSLRAHHLGDLAHKFLLASGKLQTLCYKEEIESALRTPGMGGFELLDLHDFPGQGTALVGVLDPFWEDKGYVTAAEYNRFCNSTVPLARLAKRVFTSDETLDADLEVAHFGPAPLEQASVDWKLVGANNQVVKSGELSVGAIPIGNGTSLGSVRINLKPVPTPARYKLIVSVRGRQSGSSAKPNQVAENDWDVWVYPPKVDTAVPAGVRLARELDDETVRTLNSGGKVLLLLPPERVKGDTHGKIALGFSSIFWNTAWTHRQAPHTLGILCDPKNPALAEFPTEDHSNWQWWYLIHNAGAMILDDLPPALHPTVEVIDDWVTNRKLALVFEAKVGAGRLMVCSIDLQNANDPVSRQMLRSLLGYMSSAKFNPGVAVTPDQVRGLTRSPSASSVRALKADSAQPGYEAENAIDGDPNTFWHTSWEEPATAFPHELQFSLDQATHLRGFKVLPRQDGNANGWIKDYEFYVSADGKNWGAPVAKGVLSKDAKLKTVMLNQPVDARFVRLVAVSGYASGPWASLAEFEVVK